MVASELQQFNLELSPEVKGKLPTPDDVCGFGPVSSPQLTALSSLSTPETIWLSNFLSSCINPTHTACGKKVMALLSVSNSIAWEELTSSLLTFNEA